MPGMDRLGGAWRMHADGQRLIDHAGRNRRHELSAPAQRRDLGARADVVHALGRGLPPA